VKIEIPEGVKYIIGIDEVGRGPLAGPIAFCAFKIPADFSAKGFGIRIRDSKLLTPEKREEIFCRLLELKRKKKVDFAVCFEGAKQIDHINIAEAGKRCIKNTLKKLKAKPKECLVLLDGGIKAPKQFMHQKTIIGGDRKVRAIAFASIAAKVNRDDYMCKLAKKYPAYGFEIHKGYGTKLHRERIRQFGLCREHRASFCRKLLSQEA
jgi:ribonuclease HII